MKDEIKNLTNLWMNIVSLDHHKDRDCHFFIYERYSYGNDPVYLIEHNGYIGAIEDDNIYDSMDDARAILVKHIKDMLNEEWKHAKVVIGEGVRGGLFDDQVENAKEVIRLINEYKKIYNK